MTKERKVLLILEINIVWLSVVESIFFSYFTENFTRYMTGAVIGTMAAILFVRNIYTSLDNSLDMQEDDAIKFYKKGAIKRVVLLALLVCGSVLVAKYISVLAIFLSVLNVKFAAYLQPLTNKYVLKKFSEKGR